MKKVITTILCFVLVFAFISSAMAVGVYKEVGLNETLTLATSSTRSDTFTAQISSNSQFNSNPSRAGINVRVYRYTTKYTSTLTFKSSDVPSYKTSSYTYPTKTGTFKAMSNLNSYAMESITFSGNLYF